MSDQQMISVVISINGNPITGRSATNIGNVGKNNRYMCDDGIIILHNHDDGVIKLATKMLNRIKEINK